MWISRNIGVGRKENKCKKKTREEGNPNKKKDPRKKGLWKKENFRQRKTREEGFTGKTE